MLTVFGFKDGRVAELDDILPDGYELKKGDGVYYLSYAMGRMSNIWGDDAEDFKPERWLNDNGVFQPESPFKFIAFHVSIPHYHLPILFLLMSIVLGI